jgi:hypothetical protein
MNEQLTSKSDPYQPNNTTLSPSAEELLGLAEELFGRSLHHWVSMQQLMN